MTDNEKMTDNEILVRYFVKEYLGNNVNKLANVVSPQFAYILNHRTRKDFNQFSARMRLYTGATIIKIGEISSSDDIHFHYDFEIELPGAETEIITRGFAQIIVRNGLVHQVDINYHNSQEEFEEFQEMVQNSSTVYL